MAVNEDYSLLECDVTQTRRLAPTFWGKLISPSSGYKSGCDAF
jgi:hypothetical protein